jgi:flagellar biosynthesis/type III secretory pathway M-ring protein FliF/YscJ
MLFKALSAAVYGIDANIIDVEVDFSGIQTQEDHFHTVGLPDAAVRESRDRVRAAIKNSGFAIPADAHHHQPGPGGHQEGKARASTCPLPSAFLALTARFSSRT